MGKRFMGLLALWLLALTLAACNGGPVIGPDPDPDPDFTRLTAQVLDAAGTPLSGLNVRVEGSDTGAVTDATGRFNLDAGDFPNGVDAANEIVLGRNGIVMGAREVVPADAPDLTIRFGDPATGTGSATVNLVVANEFTNALLAGVQVTLFSLDNGVFQGQTDAGGAASFGNVPAGSWQLIGFKDGFQPEMAFITLADGQTLDHRMQLAPEGQIRPGEGVMVRGVLRDSATNAPIAGAQLSLMADTGYIGLPEPGIITDVANGVATPGAEPAKGPSMFAPWRYDPQYQETTTEADGSFEFPDAVVGYSIWLSMNAEGYLAGSHYESISSDNDIELQLQLTPIVETAISGRVVDEDGAPVEGAYVEFIFNGYNGGGPMPMDDFAVPPVAGDGLQNWVDTGAETRDNVGAPPPPSSPGSEGSFHGGGDWDDVASPAAGGGAPGGGSTGPNFDNQMMQRFRWEQQNGRESSDVAGFAGYVSVVTEADGTFEITGVPAGPYWMFASAYRHTAYSSDFVAEADPAENTIDILLPNIPVGSVTGVVTDENGDPIADVLVNAVQPNVDPFTYTDSQGRYRIDNVPAGTWTISGYKQGYLTVSHDTDITDGGVASVNLSLHSYTPPPATLIPFTGRVFDGTNAYDAETGQFDPAAGIVGADLVFTPIDNEFGSYAQHVVSGEAGNYGVSLINNFEYNLLIQAPEYQDLFTRIWVDRNWPMLDFSLWPVSGGPVGGGGGGGVIDPMPLPGGGSTEPGGAGGGDPGFDGGDDDDAPNAR